MLLESLWSIYKFIYIKGALAGLRHFLATETPSKTMKNLFSFWRYVHFCSYLFDHVVKRLDKKAKAIFKIYGVPQNGEQIITISNIAQYLMQ